ncbi:MAG: glycoside hydrolase family 3 C-terminal domain-containing protein [Erythrobacter sp.]|uniref:glycoside hydrolase family 3 C-terminal domain-containing protein n=1 Tax=Erythrobacter sp. TaxID=1042 RepID=UPI002622D55D|nr:glycoside hydrolase family 3 C-terminal domain-containing protein [Erythrobacter sp.]MDJ0979092.1 glycoside hydrolase family 3 C-terminal domain-containing protein [Erythrobacter sp.]
MTKPKSDLTLDQKIDLLTGSDFWRTASSNRTGIPQVKLSDGPNGARGDLANFVTAASFPVGVSLGASWNTDLVRDIGRALGEEAHTKRAHVLLGPTINLQRTPIGGRNFECLSEDPVLTGFLSTAYVLGVQSTGVGACPKHFVANDCEVDRLTVDCVVDEQALREVYLRPFEMTVKAADPWMIMAAYNFVNGVQMCAHGDLIEGVLRSEWGFEGVVVSDWGAARDTIGNALGGLDLEMPGPSRVWGDQLKTALESGDVPLEVIDAKIARLERLAERAQAQGDADDPEASVDDPERRKLIRRAAAEGTVLLKNQRQVLPLDPADLRSLAVIGPNAQHGQIMGGGSSFVRSHPISHPLAALRDRLPGVDIQFEKGCSNAKYVEPASDEELQNGAGQRGLMLARFDGPSEHHPLVSEEKHAANSLLFFGEANLTENEQFVRLSGEFIPQKDGDFDLGLFSAGPARLIIDDEIVIDNWDSFAPGGSYFGFGSDEIRATKAFVKGCRYALRIEYLKPANALIAGFQFGIAKPSPADSILRAVELAQQADRVLLVLGSNSDWETEGEDRSTRALPGPQDELAEAVLDARPDAIVVMNVGAATAMPWYDRASTVLVPWFPGEEFGNALVDVLLGEAEPSGRLPFTWPREVGDHSHSAFYPPKDGRLVYGEGLLIGHRWYDRRGKRPLAAFGFGLGYGKARLLQVSTADNLENACVVSIHNDGDRPTAVVVQIYAETASADPSMPIRVLAGFAKVVVEPGATMDTTVPIDPAVHSSWSKDLGDWQTNPRRLCAALSAAGPFVYS